MSSETIARLREAAKAIPFEVPEFPVGSAVRLDNGCIGVVWGFDAVEGTTYVIYEEDGKVRGPSYGWHLTPFEGD